MKKVKICLSKSNLKFVVVGISTIPDHSIIVIPENLSVIKIESDKWVDTEMVNHLNTILETIVMDGSLTKPIHGNGAVLVDHKHLYVEIVDAD